MYIETKSNGMTRWTLFLTGIAFVASLFVGSVSGAAAATDEEIAVSLATLLRASRAVISKN